MRRPVGSKVLPNFLKWRPKIDLQPFHARSDLLPYALILWEKVWTVDSSETFKDYGIIFSAFIELNEIKLAFYEQQPDLDIKGSQKVVYNYAHIL